MRMSSKKTTHLIAFKFSLIHKIYMNLLVSQIKVSERTLGAGEQSLLQCKSTPHRRVNHRECTGLSCGSTYKRDNEDPLRSIEQRELQPLVPRVGQQRSWR